MPSPTSDRDPDFGPRGYLPPRAAKRARKIVLREQMGLGWPLAAVAAALLVAVVGALFLLRSGPPPAPFVPAGPLDAVALGSAGVVTTGEGRAVLVTRGGGALRAFSAPLTEVRYCASSRQLESPSGAVWTLDGVLVGGDGASLQPLRSTVYDGIVYVVPRNDDPSPPLGEPRGEQPACT